nr:phosphoribosyltransferase family protein [Kineosporia babensis]
MTLDVLWRCNPALTSRLVIPYLPYSRSETPIPRASLGAAALLRHLDALPTVRSYVLCEPHNSAVAGFSTRPVDCLSVIDDVVPWIQDTVRPEVVVAPDRGRAAQAVDIAHRTGILAEVLMKHRNDHEDRPQALVSRRPAVQDKRVLLVDDELTTGQTAAGAVDVLRRNGAGRTHLLVHRSFASDATVSHLQQMLAPGVLATTALTERPHLAAFERLGLPILNLPHMIGRIMDSAAD